VSSIIQDREGSHKGSLKPWESDIRRLNDLEDSEVKAEMLLAKVCGSFRDGFLPKGDDTAMACSLDVPLDE
jgi:hypothetical protein